MANILVVDDDRDITRLIERVLNFEHVVTTVNDSKKIKYLNLMEYELIILDIMMPDIDGFSICKNIRDLTHAPIVFLTAKTSEESLVEGFSIGADDYIKKPFSIDELRARINSHLRREKREKNNFLKFGNIFLDIKKMECKVGSTIIDLTKSEFKICKLLAINKNQVFSREQIYEKIYGIEKMGDESSITEHIKNIRTKFKAKGENPISTIWGVGYKWNTKEK